MLKSREEVLSENTWNVAALCPTIGAWQKEFDQEYSSTQTPRWPDLARYQGKLGEGTQVLKETFDHLFEIHRKAEKLYTYAHLRHDEDIANDTHKAAYQRIYGILHELAQESSWIEPELLALPQKTLDSYLASSILKDYRFHLEKILRLKDHTLTSENERLIALAGNALQATHKAFSAINDADFKFGTAANEKGEEKEITHGSYALFIRSHDRTLRKNAFTRYHTQFMNYENSLCELLQGQVQSHLFVAKAKNYKSCLEAALYPKNIDTAVYHSLVQAVNENLDALHDYNALRKKFLNLQELHLYDVYVPLTKDLDITMPYKEAEDIVVESVAPLGTEYQNILRKGFKEQRWVDRYENKNKRSGAYSSGCFDSMPYILMNYKDLLRDVFTLAHEAGHSMHSYYSRKQQPYHYADYPIFLAEVASTFNEDLLTRLMIERAKTPEEKIFLINQKIEDVRGTLFRQTMFAEFELLIHQLAEERTPLTPTLLKEKYRELNTKYFGPGVVIDSAIDIEWARIPHFYYNFYVYQYATGISAALALSDRVVQGGKSEQSDYLNFLKGGSSRYPIDLLKGAGVDMTTQGPVHQAIDKFRGWVKELGDLSLALHGSKC